MTRYRRIDYPDGSWRLEEDDSSLLARPAFWVILLVMAALWGVVLWAWLG